MNKKFKSKTGSSSSSTPKPRSRIPITNNIKPTIKNNECPINSDEIHGYVGVIPTETELVFVKPKSPPLSKKDDISRFLYEPSSSRQDTTHTRASVFHGIPLDDLRFERVDKTQLGKAKETLLVFSNLWKPCVFFEKYKHHCATSALPCDLKSVTAMLSNWLNACNQTSNKVTVHVDETANANDQFTIEISTKDGDELLEISMAILSMLFWMDFVSHLQEFEKSQNTQLPFCILVGVEFAFDIRDLSISQNSSLAYSGEMDKKFLSEFLGFLKAKTAKFQSNGLFQRTMIRYKENLMAQCTHLKTHQGLPVITRSVTFDVNYCIVVEHNGNKSITLVDMSTKHQSSQMLNKTVRFIPWVNAKNIFNVAEKIRESPFFIVPDFEESVFFQNMSAGSEQDETRNTYESLQLTAKQSNKDTILLFSSILQSILQLFDPGHVEMVLDLGIFEPIFKNLLTKIPTFDVEVNKKVVIEPELPFKSMQIVSGGNKYFLPRKLDAFLCGSKIPPSKRSHIVQLHSISEPIEACSSNFFYEAYQADKNRHSILSILENPIPLKIIRDGFGKETEKSFSDRFNNGQVDMNATNEFFREHHSSFFQKDDKEKNNEMYEDNYEDGVADNDDKETDGEKQEKNPVDGKNDILPPYDCYPFCGGNDDMDEKRGDEIYFSESNTMDEQETQLDQNPSRLDILLMNARNAKRLPQESANAYPQTFGSPSEGTISDSNGFLNDIGFCQQENAFDLIDNHPNERCTDSPNTSSVIEDIVNTIIEENNLSQETTQHSEPVAETPKPTKPKIVLKRNRIGIEKRNRDPENSKIDNHQENNKKPKKGKSK